MADHLAQRFGTEKDRVNCPFYIKIGACRHGDRCSRHHNKPHLSATILMPNLYVNPALNAPLGPDGLPIVVDPTFVQGDYEAFYEDVFEEMDKHGKIECLNVCDNYSDHLVGNVYVKFSDEQSALNAMTALQNRDLRKHLFGRYKRQEKKAAAAAGGAPAPVDEDTSERRSRRSRSPPREAARESSAERRARIAEWSRKFREQGAAP